MTLQKQILFKYLEQSWHNLLCIFTTSGRVRRQHVVGLADGLGVAVVDEADIVVKTNTLRRRILAAQQAAVLTQLEVNMKLD